MNHPQYTIKTASPLLILLQGITMNSPVLNHIYWKEYRHLMVYGMLFSVWWWLILSNKISDFFWLHPTILWVCDYLSMLGLKMNHVDKRGPIGFWINFFCMTVISYMFICVAHIVYILYSLKGKWFEIFLRLEYILWYCPMGNIVADIFVWVVILKWGMGWIYHHKNRLMGMRYNQRWLDN